MTLAAILFGRSGIVAKKQAAHRAQSAGRSPHHPPLPSMM
jgi:hypothetical protein